MKKPYPLTIVSDRYTGTYSGGIWTAWWLYPEEVPYEIFADDCTCADFWDEKSNADYYEDVSWGIGNTIEEAVEDLCKKIPKDLIH